MEKKPLLYKLEVESTPEELENFQQAMLERANALKEEQSTDEPPKMLLRRIKQKAVSKFATPLYMLEDIFINEQKGRNNSKNTILYYEKVFRNLYRFIAYATSKSSEDYSKILDEFENEETFGKCLPIATLEMDDFDSEYREYILDVLECSEQTMNNLFRGYRAIAYFAMDKGWIDSRRIQIKDIDPPIKQTFTQQEIEKLTKKPDIDNFIEYRNWVISCYMLATGSRIGSVASLKVEDIDLDEGYANINIIKNRTPIRIPLVRSIRNKLKEYIYAYRSDENGNPLYEEYLFPNSYGSQTNAMALGKSMAHYHLSRGVSKTSCHLYRHTYAKNWILDGGDILTLQKMLGHKSLKMVQRYANLYAPDVMPKAEEHALLNQVSVKSGRQKLKRRK